MTISFNQFELPILESLDSKKGEANIKYVYDWIKNNKKEIFIKNPEILGKYKKGQIIWKNKIRFARLYLIQKKQLSSEERGVWKITVVGKDRLYQYIKTGIDPDQGMEIFNNITDETKDPDKIFKKPNIFEHGNQLGFKGIMYEPNNEQGVILLFAAMAEDLGFLIYSIRSAFPDALLERKNKRNLWEQIRAEFEFKASSFIHHRHNPSECDLIICWENDDKNKRIKVPILSLKEEIKKLRN